MEEAISISVGLILFRVPEYVQTSLATNEQGDVRCKFDGTDVAYVVDFSYLWLELTSVLFM